MEEPRMFRVVLDNAWTVIRTDDYASAEADFNQYVEKVQDNPNCLIRQVQLKIGGTVVKEFVTEGCNS